MKQGKCLRIYLIESDRIGGKPALEAVLELCRKAGLRGVSVVRGVEGLGHHGVHTTSFLSLSSELPLLIESIDENDRIDAAVEMMRPYLGHRLLATWPVSIMRYSEENPND